LPRFLTGPRRKYWEGSGDCLIAVVNRFVLINNAGFFIPKPFTEYTTEDFNALVSTTLAGFLYVSQLAVKQMLRQKSGSIINISTTLVDQPIAGVGAAVQIMLKGALNAVTRALAIEYTKEGIRVNTIAPGVINTPMHKPETHEFLRQKHTLPLNGSAPLQLPPTRAPDNRYSAAL
jgi:NAD(P)-dependent dehydrogenase (short-subunit alcohol dehydrogenase family)